MKFSNFLLALIVDIIIFSQRISFGQLESGWYEGLMGHGARTEKEWDKLQKIADDPNNPRNKIERYYESGSSKDIDYLAEIALPKFDSGSFPNELGRRINAVKALGDTGSLKAIKTLVDIVKRKERRVYFFDYDNKVVCPLAEEALQKIKEKNGWTAFVLVFLYADFWIVILLIIGLIITVVLVVKKIFKFYKPLRTD